MFQNTENHQDFEVITVGLAIFRYFPRTHKNAARSYRAEHTHILILGGAKQYPHLRNKLFPENAQRMLEILI